MKLPGRAWLEFEVDGRRRWQHDPADGDLRPGRAARARVYWYGLFPIHSWIFAGMLDQDRSRCAGA